MSAAKGVVSNEMERILFEHKLKEIIPAFRVLNIMRNPIFRSTCSDYTD